MFNQRLDTDYYREERTYKMAPEFGVSLTGHKKTLEGGIGTGGGYVAYQQPQNNYNVFDEDQKRKHVDLSGVSAFCAQQTQWS